MARTIIGIPTGNSNFLISEIVRTPGLPSRITHLKKHGMTHSIILWQMGNILLLQPIFQYNFQYFILVFKTKLRVIFESGKSLYLFVLKKKKKKQDKLCYPTAKQNKRNFYLTYLMKKSSSKSYYNLRPKFRLIPG